VGRGLEVEKYTEKPDTMNEVVLMMPMIVSR
jgi:hypothetical protein